jgi:hypothetical protein
MATVTLNGSELEVLVSLVLVAKITAQAVKF